MREQLSISTTKVERAGKFVATGIKVGSNYVKHYSRRLAGQDANRELLHEDNAEDIYETLSELKGSALKVAQMLSMDRGMLPKAYQDKFALSQYNAPPLSGPLVTNTFMRAFGKPPKSLYDSFNMTASNAASIGQVHEATKNGTRLAVKVQYPGIANSISSDLKLVKPFALRIAGLSERDANKYFQEVESKLLEETDYELELRRSIDLSERCAHIPNLTFPKYYPALSGKRIITMDWLSGLHLREFLATNPTQEVRDRVGQALWDFYDFQVHHIRSVHADPHPGNFLMQSDGTVGIFDFGCIKEIPEDFYTNYFKLIDPKIYDRKDEFRAAFTALEIIHPKDTEAEKQFFGDIFWKMIQMLSKPFTVETFDFSDHSYFDGIYAYFDYVSNLPEIKESRIARGSKHSLYVNRTYFGLYSILNQLGSRVRTKTKLKL